MLMLMLTVYLYDVVIISKVLPEVHQSPPWLTLRQGVVDLLLD